MSLMDELGLNPEQQARLRAEIMGGAVVPPPEELAPPPEARNDEEWVFTNISGGDLILPDLGVLSGDKKHFTPEVLPLGTTKNLRDYYSPKELKACRTIRRALDAGLLAKGKAQQPALNLISQMAKNNPNGQFEDPSSGQGEYDKKLAELERKDEEEDQRTRKGYKPTEAARR